jgi:hypothetical protein
MLECPTIVCTIANLPLLLAQEATTINTPLLQLLLANPSLLHNINQHLLRRHKRPILSPRIHPRPQLLRLLLELLQHSLLATMLLEVALEVEIQVADPEDVAVRCVFLPRVAVFINILGVVRDREGCAITGSEVGAHATVVVVLHFGVLSVVVAAEEGEVLFEVVECNFLVAKLGARETVIDYCDLESGEAELEVAILAGVEGGEARIWCLEDADVVLVEIAML